jgi:hypothetical protein
VSQEVKNVVVNLSNKSIEISIHLLRERISGVFKLLMIKKRSDFFLIVQQDGNNLNFAFIT